jgi:hypothetical protein
MPDLLTTGSLLLMRALRARPLAWRFVPDNRMVEWTSGLLQIAVCAHSIYFGLSLAILRSVLDQGNVAGPNTRAIATT